MLVNHLKAWDVAMDAWEKCNDYGYQSTFGCCVHQLKDVCNVWPLFFEYVNDFRAIPYKEEFLKAWTKKVIHLGNTIPNRYG